MLRFITKEEYWRIEDTGILNKLPKKFAWHIKSVQDAIIFDLVYSIEGKKIAEIGGGDSRILPVISANNTCYNIEEFKGIGNGPKEEVFFEDVQNISVLMGDFSELIEPDFLDIIFSISVVEHIPLEKLDDFFKDCYRVLKSGGMMIHAIDVYLEDDKSRNAYATQRVERYRSVFTHELFKPLQSERILKDEDIWFRTTYITNPDNMMGAWNRLSPELKEKRAVSQGCSMLLIGIKP